MAITPKGVEFYEPLNRSQEVHEAIHEFLHNEWLPEHERTTDDPLFHYTTLAGLRGIVTSRSIWCGHAASFNDPLEIEYGKKIIFQELTKAKEAEPYKSVILGTDYGPDEEKRKLHSERPVKKVAARKS